MPKTTTTYACGCQRIAEWEESEPSANVLPVKHIYCGPHYAALTDAEKRVARILHDTGPIMHLPIIHGFSGPHGRSLAAAKKRVADIRDAIAAQKCTVTDT